MIKVGSDFSGVGAFNQALIRLGIKYEEVFACDMDKYARQTFILNYGEPKYYPENVYEREIPTESLDILEIQKDKSCIEKSLKITLEENLSEEKLFTTLILLKQIMTSKIYTYVKMPLNTQRFISSTVVYEKKSERLSLSCLKMEYTEQVVSDSMLYKQAGNSICVGVLAALIEKLNL